MYNPHIYIFLKTSSQSTTSELGIDIGYPFFWNGAYLPFGKELLSFASASGGGRA